MQKTAIGSSAKLLARLAAGSSASPANFKQIARQIAKQRSEAGMFGYVNLPKNLQKPDMSDAASVRRMLVPGEAARYQARIARLRDRIAGRLSALREDGAMLTSSEIAAGISEQLRDIIRKPSKKPGVVPKAWWAAKRYFGLRPASDLDLLRVVKTIPDDLAATRRHKDILDDLWELDYRLARRPRINSAAFSRDELEMLRRAAISTGKIGKPYWRANRLREHDGRLSDAALNTIKYQTGPPTFAAARGPLPVQSTPEIRLKAFNLPSMQGVPEGGPVWYTKHPDVVRGYATGQSVGRGGGSDGRQAIAVTDENTLRQFGPVGPLQPHIGVDTRGLPQPPKRPLVGRNARLGERPDYEQVATMPDLTSWIKAHRFIAPDRHNPTRLKLYSPRALGKDFG